MSKREIEPADMPKTKYDAWESGSQADPVRNNFLIPALSRLLDAHRPASILDVGTATGYVARTVNRSLSYAPEWTLLDQDEQALSFAKSRTPSEMRVSFVQSGLNEYHSDRKFDAILMTFTLLEFCDRSSIFARLKSLLSAEGILAVATPDCLQDLVEQCEKEEDYAVLSAYVTEVIELKKVDKFTEEPYPFFAERVSATVSRALSVGLNLTELERATTGTKATYLSVFRKGTVTP